MDNIFLIWMIVLMEMVIRKGIYGSEMGETQGYLLISRFIIKEKKNNCAKYVTGIHSCVYVVPRHITENNRYEKNNHGMFYR